MNYEVYSYWNLLELQGVFNAIAALTASNDFTGLLRVLALVAMIALVLAVLAGRARHEDFWRWVIMAAIVNGMLLVPKTSVILVDRTGTEPNRVVANVPVGLAALAHGTSKIGDWLTRAYETVFALPDDLQFQKRGLMFGHAVLTETQFLSPDMVSGAWMKDFQEFWRECVTPDIITNYLPLDTLRKTTDLWAALGDTNPARYVTLTTVGTVPCHPTAYNDLGNRLNNSVVPALITSYGLKKFPNDPQAVTNAQNGIVASYAFGPGISNTAHNIVKQAAMQQAMVQAYCGVFSQSGDSNRAALCYSTAMGAYQTNHTYQVLAKIAESSMPKLKSAIEIIQYAVAPIILAFAVVAGHLALPVLKTYTMSLVWIQLWPPLYAVVHYIQTVKMQAYEAALGASAGTLEGSAQLVNMGVSDQAVAGMLTLAIPPIAAALVKGGEVGLQAVAGLVSAPRTAERQAADVAKGNESVGQWKTSPMVDYAASPTPVMARRNDDGSYTYTHPDGGVTYNVGTAMDRASFSVKSTDRAARSASRMSEEAEMAARGHMVSAGTETAASFQRLADFVKSHGKGASTGTSFSEQDLARISQAYNQAQDIARNFEKQLGLKEGMGAKVMGSLAASGGLELAGNGVKAELKAMGLSEATLSDEKKMAEAYRQAKSFQQAMERAHQVSRQEKFDTGESSEAKAMRGLRASLDQAQRYSESASANLQRSMAYKELAGYIREGAVSIDQDLTTRIMNRLASERATIDGHTYNGFKKEEVDALMRLNIPEMRALVERLANEETEAFLREKFGHLKTPNDVRAFFNASKPENTVAQQGERRLGDVHAAAGKTGVDPDKGVTSRLPGKVQGELEQTGNAVQTGQATVESSGKPIEGTVTKETQDPGSLAARAASNASTSVLPQGTTYLADKVGLAPGSFAKREAETYKGDTTDALIDTAIFAGSLAVGGVAGRVAGKVVGANIGKKAGEVAAKEILAENATTAVGYNYPGLTSIVANQARQEAIEAGIAAGARDGVKVGIGVGDVVGKNLADNNHPGLFLTNGELYSWDQLRKQSSTVLDEAWNFGEQTARRTFGEPPVTQQPVGQAPGMGAGVGTPQAHQPQGQPSEGPFGGSPGKSNLGKALGGGQRPVSAQPQPTSGEVSQQKSDAPPPRGR